MRPRCGLGEGSDVLALRDGAILANAGHFDVEIDVRALAGAAVKITRDVRPPTNQQLLHRS